MARRFETQYKTKRLDNLGDPEWHNVRWDDIDRRMHARELDATKIDDAVDSIEAVALARLNDNLTPIIAQATTRLIDFGLLFSATSHTERTIQTGSVELIVDVAMRDSYVATGFVLVRPTDDLTMGMTCRTLSYDIGTGTLLLDSYNAIGEGTFNNWTVSITGDPDLSHSTRTDNPHGVTAEQTGAYTTTQTDTAIGAAVGVETSARATAISTAVSNLIDGAPSALNTLNEIAAAIADDATFYSTVNDKLDNRVRVDASQTLTSAQKLQARENIDAGRAGDLLFTFDATPPTQCVELDGATISGGAATYPKVAARYPWMVSSGNIILPDARGKFLRTWAHGSSNDPDRASRTARAGDGQTGDYPGTNQADEFKSHNHSGQTFDASGSAGHTTGGTGYQTIGYAGGNETRPINLNVCVWMRMG